MGTPYFKRKLLEALVFGDCFFLLGVLDAFTVRERVLGISAKRSVNFLRLSLSVRRGQSWVSREWALI